MNADDAKVFNQFMYNADMYLNLALEVLMLTIADSLDAGPADSTTLGLIDHADLLKNVIHRTKGIRKGVMDNA
jgi:hypothetical protein